MKTVKNFRVLKGNVVNKLTSAKNDAVSCICQTSTCACDCDCGSCSLCPDDDYVRSEASRVRQ